jgi:hypothetical protein
MIFLNQRQVPIVNSARSNTIFLWSNSDIFDNLTTLFIKESA